MQDAVALRDRGRLAAILNRTLQVAGQAATGPQPDVRNMRTLRQLILGLLVKRSTRLITLAQVAIPWRRGHTAKSVAMGLAYFLDQAKFPMGCVSRRFLETIVRRIPAEAVVRYAGKAIVVIDPTEYPKRSRGKGKGKGDNYMQHIGRVRQTRSKRRRKKRGPGKGNGQVERTATTTGYVDIWGGLVLKGKQFLPLARQLFSSSHPKLKSQSKVEQAVLFQSLGMLKRVGLKAIVVGDRGLGRKELMVRLSQAGVDFVLRIDADVSVWPDGGLGQMNLAKLLERQPWLGEVIWDRGEEGKLRCNARAVRATIRFSRSGSKSDYQEATLNFVELVPQQGFDETLVVATTLPVAGLVEARGIVRVYSYRWAIEAGFEMMKAWGLGRFMVRSWRAIERLLWVVALAYSLMTLAQYDAELARLRAQAVRLIKTLAALGHRLTAGKLAEAIGLDFAKHQRAWASVWFT